MDSYPGLNVFTHPDYPWTWSGWQHTRNKAGDQIRVELFERGCKLCGEPVTVTVRLPKIAVERYQRAAARRRPIITRGTFGLVTRVEPAPLRVAIKLPTTRWYGGLSLRTCTRHRGMRELPIEDGMELI